MSIEIKEATHDHRAGVKIFEIWSEDKMVATIYPGDRPYEMRILSRHLTDVRPVGAGFDVTAVLFQFREPPA
jgi:hypothetical protein